MLKLLHPFMPFITEEIWSNLPNTSSRLIKSEWPAYDESENFADAEQNMLFIMEAVTKIRNIRAEMNVAPSRKARAVFIPSKDNVKEYLEGAAQYFATLANITDIQIVSDKSEISEDTATGVMDGTEICLPLADLIDFEKEIERLEKEKVKLQSELDRVNGKLSNEKFMGKAPENLVAEEREKLAKYQEMMNTVSERLEQMKNR